jgi:mevalonate kinase
MAVITFFSAAITLFSAAVTFFAWRNGRIIKETSLHTQELIKETSQQTQQLIREEMRENRLLLEKISELISHIPAKTKELMKE